MNIHQKYQPSGWLSEAAMQYGNQHRQTDKTGEGEVRFRAKRAGYYLVERMVPKSDEVIGQPLEFFDLTLARKAYGELLGKKPDRIYSEDARQDIIL